jgi:hypothetical protein
VGTIIGGAAIVITVVVMGDGITPRGGSAVKNIICELRQPSA